MGNSFRQQVRSASQRHEFVEALTVLLGTGGRVEKHRISSDPDRRSIPAPRFPGRRGSAGRLTRRYTATRGCIGAEPVAQQGSQSISKHSKDENTTSPILASGAEPAIPSQSA